jgi:hypothetical protein
MPFTPVLVSKGLSGALQLPLIKLKAPGRKTAKACQSGTHCVIGTALFRMVTLVTLR